MKKILKGYTSLVREMLGLHNDASYLSPPANLVVLIAICGLIGLLRNTLQISLGVGLGFFRYHLDLLWTMFNFPVQLCLFPGALLHWQLHLLGYRRVRVETIIGLSFYLQILHLIVPFLDWVGYQLGMPPAYKIGFGSHIVRTKWYTNQWYLTPGIIVGWWVTAYIVARVFRKRLDVRWSHIILTSLTTFMVILVPTYLIFPTFNTLFNHFFGLWFWRPQAFLYDSPSWFLHWGYGTYFGLTALIGLTYYVRQRRHERLTSP